MIRSTGNYKGVPYIKYAQINLVVFLLFICSATFGQMRRETLNYNGILYLKYTPTTMQAKGSILFLHGSGERGSDLSLVEHNEIPKQMLTMEVPYIVIAPQLPLSQGGWWEFITNPMVQLMKTLPGHKHLTGLSLGAMRVTVILAENPGVFQSASTVCGTNDVPMMGVAFAGILNSELIRMPTIHYYDPLDKTIQSGGGYASIKLMCDQLAGKADITYQDINLTGTGHHAIWPIAYQPANFWKWLDSKVSPPAVVDDVVVKTIFDGVNIIYTTQSGKTLIVKPQ